MYGTVHAERYIQQVHCTQPTHLLLYCVLCRSIDQNLVTVSWRRGVFEETAVIGTFVHPSFAGNENTLDYGFAILQLATSSAAEDIVQLNSDPAVPDNATELGVLGSGFDSTLNEANVFALTDEECASSKNLVGFPIQVGESQMCAGDGESGYVIGLSMVDVCLSCGRWPGTFVIFHFRC